MMQQPTFTREEIMTSAGHLYDTWIAAGQPGIVTGLVVVQGRVVGVLKLGTAPEICAYERAAHAQHDGTVHNITETPVDRRN